MAGFQFLDHRVQQAVECLARPLFVDQRLIFIPNRVPVHAVELGIKKIVAEGLPDVEEGLLAKFDRDFFLVGPVFHVRKRLAHGLLADDLLRLGRPAASADDQQGRQNRRKEFFFRLHYHGHGLLIIDLH